MNLLKIFLLLFMTFSIGGCTLFRTVEYETADGIALQKLNCQIKSDKQTDKIALQHEKNILTLTLNSRLADFNGIKIWLYSPAKPDIHGDLRINKINIEKIINPLLLQKYIF